MSFKKVICHFKIDFNTYLDSNLKIKITDLKS